MKNPFANLFKKKPKSDAPVPKPESGNKKESFFSKFLKKFAVKAIDKKKIAQKPYIQDLLKAEI